MTDDGENTRLSLPGFHLSRDIGEPELPEIHSLIETLVDDQQDAGSYTLVWDAAQWHVFSPYGNRQ